MLLVGSCFCLNSGRESFDLTACFLLITIATRARTASSHYLSVS